MKAVALYLPQFHQIPENDAWWGEGFTEWTNVKRAGPRYPGHYQPHVPHPAIGYYALDDVAFIEKQHAMALRYGVGAFCYYYYHLAGRNILGKPLEIINASHNIKNEFCLCWANHDWTRTWFGQSKELLVKQTYSPEEAQKIIEDMSRFFVNPRYIKINGRPLLLVFSPADIPIIHEYREIWNAHVRGLGLESLYLVTFEVLEQGVNPALYGFDAALEFGPDWVCAAHLPKEQGFPRRVDYTETVKRMMQKPLPPYQRMRTVFPGWDNTPRYGESGLVFENDSLGAFRFFTEYALRHTRENLPEHLQYLFINAWNEWGEGCHLEPDTRTGFLPLRIVREAMQAICPAP